MTHRSGWRNPLRERGWEATFQQHHADPAIPLLVLFWASISAIEAVPQAARIASLPALEQAAQNHARVDFAAARRALFAHFEPANVS